MLLQRLLTAAVGIPVLLALILAGGAVYAIALAIILALAALEFFAATDPDQRPPTEPGPRAWAGFLAGQRPVGAVGAVGIILIVAAVNEGFQEWTAALALAIAIVFIYLIVQGDPRSGLQDWLRVSAGIAYVGFFGAHLIPLRELEDGEKWVILAVFGTFAADTFAYFVGRPIGRTKIAPTISPGKTVEGTAAGLIGGFASVLVLNWITGLNVDLETIAPLAILLPIAAFVGDLAESLIKRGAGVKDTSDLIPGHGGFLDRIDAVLFTTPLVYYFVIWAVL